MNEATPSPWRIVRHGETVLVAGADYTPVFEVDCYYSPPISEANAELIVRAVNLLNESRKVVDANTQPEASAVQLPQSSDPVLLSLPKNPAFHGSRDCDENGQTNERRAQRAFTALLSYIGTDRLDDTYDTHLQDLLNDLMHLACRENLDFNDALRMAESNYKEEK